ncbi:hypothetical protein COU37_02395 [Candidatus Micrarchaeota archaeon CG10_big_fil_rev_8_21_14_0_10_45_29]|nr:MAG: hypothetical protein COU37_02395 [Candidatus Micrarchaeota archaeon CG10_big_fil_rev_8_21_14_0_10_45_29]
MKNLLFGIFALFLLAGSVSAYCACIEPSGPCGCSDDSYYDNEKNISVWVGVGEEADPRFIYSTDRPFGNDGLDMFEDSRDDFFSYEDTLELFLKKACVNENIEVKATYRNTPVENVRIKLYSHAGGRVLISEAYSDANGNAVFSPLSIGKYDFVAILDGYNKGQEIFSVEACESPRGGEAPGIMNKRAVERAREASLPAEENQHAESSFVNLNAQNKQGVKKEMGLLEFIFSIFE